VVEAAAVAGELTEGRDVMVTRIMMTWNIGDPMGITAGTVVDMMMMGGNTQMQWYREVHDKWPWCNERRRHPHMEGGGVRRGYATTSQTRGLRKA
jgi:hypothetical protein